MSPNEIGNKRFDSPKRGYYNSGDVDSYLSEVASFVAQLTRENADLKHRLEASSQKVEAFEKDQEALSQALLNAQRLADSIVRDAQHKAEITLSDAEIKAQQIRDKVKEAIVGEQQDFIKLREQVADFRSSILALYKKQVETVMETPDAEALGLKPKEDAAPAKSEEEPDGQAPQGAEPAASEEDAQPASGEPALIHRDVPDEPQPADAPDESDAAEPAETSARPGRNPTIAQAPGSSSEAEAASAGEPASAPQNDAAAPRLNLVYDEESGQYIPAGAPKPGKFDDLQFGTDYHIGQDDKDAGGIFHRRK